MKFVWEIVQSMMIKLGIVLVIGIIFLLLAIIPRFFLEDTRNNVPEIPERMSPARFVNDYAGLLSSAEQQQLEDSLVAFEKTTSTAIVVVTTDDLTEYTPNDYALGIFNEWGVGQNENNGAVILFAPHNVQGENGIVTLIEYKAFGVHKHANKFFVIEQYRESQDYYTIVVETINVVRGFDIKDVYVPESLSPETTKYYYRKGGGDVGQGGDAGGAGGGDSGGGGEVF